MAIKDPKQTLVVTAVPHGYAGRTGSLLAIGVHLSPRLSHASTTARLADFPDFVNWTEAPLRFQISFDAGKTWLKPVEVNSASDPAVWHGMLRPQVPVVSFDGAPPAHAAVAGYSYATVEKALLSSFKQPKLAGTDLGKLLRAVATDRDPRMGRAPTTDKAEALENYRGFYRRHGTPRVRRGSIDSDFHARIALAGDHGPLMQRLGLVSELLVNAPAKATGVQVRVLWSKPVRPVTVVSPITACVLRPATRTFLAKRRDTTGEYDAGLRLRVSEDAMFSVHSLDVDSAAAQSLAAAVAPDGAQQTPPAGRSSGLTLAQTGRAQQVGIKLTHAREAAGLLAKGKTPTLYAEDLMIGVHLHVSPRTIGQRQWFGLGHRDVTYTVEQEAGAPYTFSEVDEAAVTVAARVPDPAKPSELAVSDVVARWDGWSLAVPRPGNQLLQNNDGSTELASDSEQVPNTWATMTSAMATSAADGTTGLLPTLRYGRAYAFRGRGVDVTGVSAASWTDAPISADTFYLRWHPVPAPVVVPTELVSRSESARRMVVRSDPRESVPAVRASTRHLVPPKVSIDEGLTHGVFDTSDDALPDPDRWEEMVDLDLAHLPDLGPDDDDGAPMPIQIDWLPDPMGAGVVASMTGVGTASSTFIPGADTDTGWELVGDWTSVAIHLTGNNPTSGPGVTTIATGGEYGDQVIGVDLAPGKVATVFVRAQPAPSLLSRHGLVKQLGGSGSSQAATVAAGKLPILTPSVPITVVHAVKRPLADPTITKASITRLLGVKDPTVTMTINHDLATTGGLAVLAQWREWVDGGPGTAPPVMVDIARHTVLDKSSQADSSTFDATVRTPMPDLIHRDIHLVAVATSRFVEEFRDEVAASFQLRADDNYYLDLPDNVEVESVRVLADGVELKRGVDVATALDPLTGRYTLRATSAAALGPGLLVEGVTGSVLATSPLKSVNLRSGIRPARPVPLYAIPTFVNTGAQTSGPGYTWSMRSGNAIRVWLARPWWSSGDGERLAVITGVAKASVDAADKDPLTRLVTLAGQDPALRSGDPVTRIPTVSSGSTVDRLVIREELDPDIEKKATFLAQVHDVEFDVDRDAYYVDVTVDGLTQGDFVRLALARYQPAMAQPKAGQPPVLLSRVVTMDPIQVLGQRQVQAGDNGHGYQIRVLGRPHRGPSTAKRPFVRVSLQVKPGGGGDLGWATVSSATGFGTHDGSRYEDVFLGYGAGDPDDQRLLIEEFESWTVVDSSGTAITPPVLTADPTDHSEAVVDMIGLRPTFIATLPVPTGPLP